VTRHYLACSYQGFGCSNGHISGTLVLVILGVALVVALITDAVRRLTTRKDAGEPGRDS
jgi:hypothetical protein